MTTPTTTEYWSWNGTVLNSQWWNITSFGGSRQDLPLLRGQNYTIAYRNGQMWRPKNFDQRTVSLAMWTAGVNQTTGQPSTNQSLDFTSNFYNLRQMFAAQGVLGSQLGQLTRRWYEYVNGFPALLTATAMAELAGNMSPTMSGRTRADFTVDFLLADPFFYGSVVSLALPLGNTVAYNAGDAVVGFGQAQGNGGVPFQITLIGPLTNPTLTNVTANVSVTVGATISAGNTLTLDVAQYTALDQNQTSYLGSVTHTGARAWMALLGCTPQNPTGAQMLVLSSTGAGDTGSGTITWQPGYL